MRIFLSLGAALAVVAAQCVAMADPEIPRLKVREHPKLMKEGPAPGWDYEAEPCPEYLIRPAIPSAKPGRPEQLEYG